MKTSAFYLSILIGIILIFQSCAPKLGSSWIKPNYQGKAYKKLVVIGIGDDLNARLLFENNAVQLLNDNGVNAIPGISIFPHSQTLKEENDIEIIEILKKNNVDGVITMSLINENQSQQHIPGKIYAVPTGYTRFGNYYYRTYRYIREEGYYVDQNSYLIEAILYDLKENLKDDEDAMVWTGQSSLINPSSAENASVLFVKKMVGSLIREQIIITRK